MTDLQPCPWCGSPALRLGVSCERFTVDFERRGFEAHAVTCSDRDGRCPVVPHTRWFASAELAASEWNRRQRL